MPDIAEYILLLYVFFTFVLIVVWLVMPDVSKSAGKHTLEEQVYITVIIPVRNEEKNIIRLLKGLASQTLAHRYFEVMVVNDQSTDNTAALVTAFQSQSSMNLVLLNLEDKKDNTSPKKRAISTAVGQAKGQFIVTTDGDCEVPESWLKTYLDAFMNTDAVFLSGPVTFFSAAEGGVFSKLWNQLQIVEFASLIGSGACSMAMKTPNMCSGANLGYQKKAFYEVDGYKGNENLASGDDEFLMHKMAKAYQDRVLYLKSPGCIVETESQPTLQHFYRQRKRWAGKWKHYKSLLPALLAVFIFAANLSAVFLVATGHFEVVLLRLLAEFVFLALVLQFLKKGSSILFIPLTQLVYPFYVLFFGLIVQRGNTYTWKDRQLK